MASMISRGDSWANIRRALNAAVLSQPTAHVMRVLREGNDGNSGLSLAEAKRTILGAYDALPNGGTILVYGSAVDIGGEVRDQGLWLAGAEDPQSNSLPPGWRPARPITIVGLGGTLQTGAGSQARARVALRGGSATDRLKPTVWLACTQCPIRFVDVYLGYERARPVLVGITSNDVANNSVTAGVEFDGCAMRVTQQAGAGPGVEIGTGFDLTFRNCSIDANEAEADLTADARAAILVKPRAHTSAGPRILQCGFARGGVKYYRATSSWSLIVDDLLVEGNFVDPVPPAVWLPNADIFGWAYLKHITMADAPGSGPNVLIEGSQIPDQILCVQVGAVSGPAAILGRQDGVVA